MVKKYVRAFVVSTIIVACLLSFSTHYVNADPFMDGFPDWAQDAMGGD